MSPDQRSDDTQRAVIDRITDGWAVLLVGDREQELRVRETELPDGAEEGSIVQVRVSGLKVEVVEVDDGATDEKRAEMKDRLSRLRKSRSTGRFDSNKPRPDWRGRPGGRSLGLVGERLANVNREPGSLLERIF